MDRKIISASLVLSMILVGCGTDDSAKAEWEISQNIDNGNYQAAIDALGDCSTKTGVEQTECYTNLGAAYFGAAGFDIISLGQDLLGIDSNLTDEQKDEKFNEIIFDKLLKKETKLGTNAFEKVLGTQESNCTEAGIDKLDTTTKNACLSISPILLKDSLEDEDTSGTPKVESTNTATLSDVIEFTDVMQEAAPGISGKELADVVNNKAPSSGDANNNGELDKLEATNCLLSAYNNNNGNVTTACSSDGVTITNLGTNVFAGATGTTYDNIDSKKVTIGGVDYYKLIKDVGTNSATLYTIVNVDDTQKVDDTATVTTTTNSVNGTTVFYKPVVTTDANNTPTLGTLNDTVTTVLNDESKLKTIALLTSGEDSTKSDDDKVADFKKELCGATTTTITPSTAYGNCTVDSSGKLTIPQEAVLSYMNKN